jgi:hypothetical protein
VEGLSLFENKIIEHVIKDTVTSEEFPQNTSTTDVIERTLSYTYLDVTSTVVMIHNV